MSARYAAVIIFLRSVDIRGYDIILRIIIYKTYVFEIAKSFGLFVFFRTNLPTVRLFVILCADIHAHINKKTGSFYCKCDYWIISIN